MENKSLIEQLEEANKGVMECYAVGDNKYTPKKVVDQDEINKLTLECIKEISNILKQLSLQSMSYGE